MVIFINFPCYIHLIINLLEQYLSSTSQINFWNNQYCSFGIIFEGQHYPLRIKRERNTMCVNNTTLKVCLYMYLYAGFYIHFCKKFPISLVLLLVYLPLTLSVIQGLPALYFECESSLLFILSLPLAQSRTRRWPGDTRSAHWPAGQSSPSGTQTPSSGRSTGRSGSQPVAGPPPTNTQTAWSAFLKTHKNLILLSINKQTVWSSSL